MMRSFSQPKTMFLEEGSGIDCARVVGVVLCGGAYGL